MHQREIIIEAWEQAAPAQATASRRSESRPAKRQERSTAHQDRAQLFFELLRERRDLHWDELVKEFRTNYYDAFDEIMTALFATDDPLIIFNCIQFADLSKSNEVKALQQFIQQCDPEKHQVSLRVLAQKQVTALQAALRKKAGLPESVGEVLEASRTQVPPPKRGR